MIDWQKRFRIQLKWTKNLREYLYNKIEISSKNNLLDVGCGMGDLLLEIGTQFNLELYGIDKDKDSINLARDKLNDHNISATLQCEDFLRNSYGDGIFDIITTHYFFLWIENLRGCFNEIHRILRDDGILLILAEPDYGGLVEYPITHLKKAIRHNLLDLGAQPEIGRKLNQFFFKKFEIIEHFCISLPWISSMNKDDLLKEVKFFEKLLLKQGYGFNNFLMDSAIDEEYYFLFIPIFSFYLKKI